MLTREQVNERLRSSGQQHVLRFWDELDEAGRQRLLAAVASIDLPWVAAAYASHIEAVDPKLVRPYTDVIRADDADTAQARERGKAALAAGEVGVLLVAGGAGTRLGFDGPKGAFPIGAVSGRTLFQLHAERLVAVGARYGKVPPLYLMTSPDNHEATCRAFADNDNYGLPADRLLIFPQGLAPAVDMHGKLLMASKDSLVMSPNGNGGLFKAMRDGGAFDHMEQSGVEAVSYIQVDNALADGTDPLFLGFHLLRDCEFSCKAIAKTGPFEKVGNYAQVGPRLGIVEYFEIPEELVVKKNDEGELLFNWGNPGLFLWSRAFAAAQAARADLPVHKAHKKIPYVDSEGTLVEPSEPNGFKLETFALDTLAAAERSMVFACDRDAEFAPVKNASGVDSPDSARGLMTKLYRGWIEAAGARVADGVQLEIGARYALDADSLAPKLEAGQTFERDTFLDQR